MPSFPDAVDQDLRWIRRSRRGWTAPVWEAWEHVTDHELRKGDDVVAGIRFRNGLPVSAEADGHSWVFGRTENWPYALVTVRDAEAGSIDAVFHFGGATLADGRELRLVWKQKLLAPDWWYWQDQADAELMSFKLSWSGRVRIATTFVKISEMPLLAVLAWLGIIRDLQRSSADGGG